MCVGEGGLESGPREPGMCRWDTAREGRGVVESGSTPQASGLRGFSLGYLFDGGGRAAAFLHLLGQGWVDNVM